LPASGRFKVMVVISPSFSISIGSAIVIFLLATFPDCRKAACPLSTEARI
jgi:hypothetical protein